jgi:hypothetical protein
MFRYKDLYDHVLFNYQWLYAKMCAVPLPEVLGTVAFCVQIIMLKKCCKRICVTSQNNSCTVQKLHLLEISDKNCMQFSLSELLFPIGCCIFIG